MNTSGFYGLWLRELLRVFRSKTRIIGTLGIPFFFILVFGFGLSSFVSVEDTTYFQFIVPGMMGMTLLFQSMFGGLSVIEDKQFGFFKEILVAPIPRPLVVLGKALGTATVVTIQATMVMVAAMFLGFSFNFSLPSIVLALFSMFLVSTGFVGFGLIFAAKTNDPQSFQIIVNFLIFPLFLLAGVFFPLDSVPGWMQAVSFLDPLTYGVDLLRAALIGLSFFPTWLSISALLLFDAIALLIASSFFSQAD